MTGREARRRLAAARFVADHWRESYMAQIEATGETVPWAIGTHPLALVSLAIDGETDPNELGLNDAVHAKFREAIR